VLLVACTEKAGPKLPYKFSLQMKSQTFKMYSNTDK
jgi:hypothetical protein